MVKSQPERGCAFWDSEPGSDDEPLSTEQMRETWKHLAWPAARRRADADIALPT
jgi:hypothetical protein